MRLRPRHLARNVVCNWLATFASMAVAFFLSPYIVHRLGNVAYGVWIMAATASGYLAYLDLGMRNSVVRFVSKGYAQGDHAGASESFSAALWVRLQISLLVVLLSLGLAQIFPYLFKVPPELVGTARTAVIVIGFSNAVAMSLGVFGGIISALNRYDFQAWITLLFLVLRVAGVLGVLISGRGIVAIALVELVATMISNALTAAIALRLYPQLRVSLSRPSQTIFRQLWSYSVFAFIVTIGIQVIYQTDNLVVGAFVSASAVTFYAIGNSLTRYADQIVGSMTMTFVPAASTYEAAGDFDALRSLYRNGTRATLAVSLPILVSLLVRGRSFIQLWMGTQYAVPSGHVLSILVIALLFSAANNSGVAIAYGTSRHRTLALWTIGEATANLSLSIVLVRWFGIYGVALGTLIPSLFIHLVLWPIYTGRLLGPKMIAVYWQVRAVMFAAALPFAAVSYLVDRSFPPRNLFVFIVQCAATLPVFFGTLSLIYHKEVAALVLGRIRTLRTSVSAAD